MIVKVTSKRVAMKQVMDDKKVERRIREEATGW